VSKPKWLTVQNTVALCAALFAGLSWLEVYQHDKLEMKPWIDFHTSGGESVTQVGISIENAGPSVALIRSVTFYVDRKPVRDLIDALRSWDLDRGHEHGLELNDSPLRVGQVEWLVEYRAESDKERARVIDFLGNHLAAEAEYCSASNDCWKKCSRLDRC
jgi:hypothetical protein